MATEAVVNMSNFIEENTGKKAGPSPQELQKVLKNFADMMSELVKVVAKIGPLPEGKDIADVLKASKVAAVAKESEAGGQQRTVK